MRPFPIHTREKDCHDCYKCVRNCPVKAIRVENDHASVVPERCVACGRCIRICPSGAKRVRDDAAAARSLLAGALPVYVSLAPSWAAAHPEWSPGQWLAALRRLGFRGAGETAAGAREVSAAVVGMLNRAGPGLHISTACPALVALVRKHHPAFAGSLIPLASPLLTHCRMLRDRLGGEIRVVFIGPCAAKKGEADEHPELLDLALTFAELDEWLAAANVRPDLLSPDPEDVFLDAGEAGEGALYPLEGGMIETFRYCGCSGEVRVQSISGLGRLRQSLENLGPGSFDRPFFLEGLACRGGCVNGPCSTRDPQPLAGIMAVRSRAVPGRPGPRPGLEVRMTYDPAGEAETAWTEAEVAAALARVGKTGPADELNCGGCGYDTCRGLARALLSGDAETGMCAYYMRTIAQRKANALFRCMPSGVVIVGTDLRIMEANDAFVRLFGDRAGELQTAGPGLAGVRVDDIFPCGNLLRAALRSGREIRRERLKVGDRLLDIVVFIIEEYKTVGAIVEDVTLTEMRRDRIARRAREVINRNIATVQEIASLLGEHMADTEVLLSSIAEGYGEGGGTASGGDGDG